MWRDKEGRFGKVVPQKVNVLGYGRVLMWLGRSGSCVIDTVRYVCMYVCICRLCSYSPGDSEEGMCAQCSADVEIVREGARERMCVCETERERESVCHRKVTVCCFEKWL